MGKKAIEVWDTMGEKVLHLKNIEYQRITYNMIIIMMAECRGWKKALELFWKIQKQGGKPDRYSYKIIFNMLMNAGQWEEALKLIKPMQNYGIHDRIDIILHELNANLQDHGILKIYEEMQEQEFKPTVIAYEIFINATRRLK